MTAARKPRRVTRFRVPVCKFHGPQVQSFTLCTVIGGGGYCYQRLRLRWATLDPLPGRRRGK
jgi:hypothetical protein